MRRLTVHHHPTFPLQDCARASHLIRLLARQPRGNRHRTRGEQLERVVVGAVCLVAVGVSLTILLFTW